MSETKKTTPGAAVDLAFHEPDKAPAPTQEPPASDLPEAPSVSIHSFSNVRTALKVWYGYAVALCSLIEERDAEIARLTQYGIDLAKTKNVAIEQNEAAATQWEETEKARKFHADRAEEIEQALTAERKAREEVEELLRDRQEDLTHEHGLREEAEREVERLEGEHRAAMIPQIEAREALRGEVERLRDELMKLTLCPTCGEAACGHPSPFAAAQASQKEAERASVAFREMLATSERERDEARAVSAGQVSLNLELEARVRELEGRIGAMDHAARSNRVVTDEQQKMIEECATAEPAPESEPAEPTPNDTVSGDE